MNPIYHCSCRRFGSFLLFYKILYAHLPFAVSTDCIRIPTNFNLPCYFIQTSIPSLYHPPTAYAFLLQIPVRKVFCFAAFFLSVFHITDAFLSTGQLLPFRSLAVIPWRPDAPHHHGAFFLLHLRISQACCRTGFVIFH